MDLQVTSTPTAGRTSPLLSFDDASVVIDPNVKRKPVNLALILEAIEAVGVKRKGASVQAIKKYIEGTLSQPLDKRIITTVKRSLMKGIENGQLIRPNASQNATGCTGFFMISQTNKAKKKKETPPTEHVSDSEAKPKPKKNEKINLSDTVLQDFKAKRKLNITKLPRLKKKDDKENVKPTASKKNSKAAQLNSEADSTKKNTAKSKSTNDKAKKNEDKPESEAVKAVIEENIPVKRKADAKSGKVAAEDKTKTKPDTKQAKDNVETKIKKGKKEDKPVESNTKEIKPTRGRPAKNEGTKETKGKAESNPKINIEERKKPKGKEVTTKSKLKVAKIAKNKATLDQDENASAEELDETVFHNQEMEANDDGIQLPKTYAEDVDDRFGSDSEFVVKKPNRKSTKSYSSDTEVNNAHETKKSKGKNLKSAKVSKKDIDAELTMGKKKLFNPEVKDIDFKNTRAKRKK